MSLEDRLKAKIEISLCMAIMQNHQLPSLYTQYYRTVWYQDPEGTTVFGMTDINNRTKQSNAEEEVTLVTCTLRRRIKDLEKKITDTEVVMDSFSYKLKILQIIMWNIGMA